MQATRKKKKSFDSQLIHHHSLSLDLFRQRQRVNCCLDDFFYSCLLLACFFQSSSYLPLHMNVRHVPHVTQLHALHSKKSFWYVTVIIYIWLELCSFTCNWIEPVTWPKYRPFLQCDWTCSLPVTLNTSILCTGLNNSHWCDRWEIWASGALIWDGKAILLQEVGGLFITIPQHCVSPLKGAKSIRSYMKE